MLLVGFLRFSDAVLRLTSFRDMIYVDFSEHQEKRIPRLKVFFEYLFNKAVWHRPSVLIIDNIDALLEAEKEVLLRRVTYGGAS